MLSVSPAQRVVTKKQQVRFSMGGSTTATYDNIADEKSELVTTRKSGQIKIGNSEDLVKYLEICSGEEPLAEGHICKDIRYPTIFNRFRRRYFVLYNGLLLYYRHKALYNSDKRKGLQHSTVILLEDVYLTRSEPADSSNTPRFSFYVHAPHKLNKREEMLLAVHSRSAKHEWIEKLQAQNPKLLTPKHSPSRKHGNLHRTLTM